MGRPSKGPEALRHQVFIRLTDRQHLAYLHLGGARWFREVLEMKAASTDAAPTAHRPFPTFSVTDAKTGQPVPHTVTVMEF